MADESIAVQTAHSALSAVSALLHSAPGMHVLIRSCCVSLCQAGVAQPLVALLASGPDSQRCTEARTLDCGCPRWQSLSACAMSQLMQRMATEIMAVMNLLSADRIRVAKACLLVGPSTCS